MNYVLMMIADPFTSVCLMPYEVNDGIQKSLGLKSQLYQILSNSIWNEQKILKRQYEKYLDSTG